MRVRNVCSAALLWSAAILASGCKGTEPPVATTIVVTPGSVNFVTVNATQALSAQVLDQKGDSIPGQVITWSVDNSAIATVTTTGIATAKGNGTATVTAATGSISKTVAVTVAQAATAINKTGDAQIGTVGAALATQLSVHVQDAGGSAIPGAPVTFAVASGGGSLVGASTTTNATGDATAGWTLGTVAGAAQAVNVTSGSLTTSFTATATAGAASAVTPQAGNNQTRVTGLPVAVAPSVKVTDAFGNVKAGATVVFAPVSGGGSVTGATKTTDAAGIATVGSWTLGPAAGANSLSATVQGTAIAFTFTATAAAAGAPTTMTIVAATNNQTALQGYATNVRPAVTVTDAGGQPVAGVSVTFAIASGGGSVTGSTVNTNAFGIAQVGKWTVGAAAGANTVTATAAPGGIAGNPATITATAAAPAYSIIIQNIGPAFSPTVQAAFDSAQVRWQRTIFADVPDQPLNIPANGCGVTHPAVNQVIDDMLIFARVDSIDGPGKILGQAGFCAYRNGASLLPSVGIMSFDSADMASLNASGQLRDVILHEMGHTLGFGTLWPALIQVGFPGKGCSVNPSSTGNVQDTYFNCPLALAMFDSIGGGSYTGGNRVPVENCGPLSPAGCGGGTYNSHWREPIFGAELMTGYLNASVANPFSVLTIAAMGDLGYTVNYAAADAYTKVFTVSGMSSTTGRVELQTDIWTGPLYAVDASGNARRVR